ncbi:MAG: hypothetical protein H8E66_14795 [Planctomycetes bacterium]|nr:hypothetical protein [Planctomycetota bacterium]
MTFVETQNVVWQEATSSTKGDREASGSLLGSVARGMRLQVSDGESGNSEIIEVRSRSCLVGAAPNCDVRVDQPGVAAIECLILHGAKNKVIRWLDASPEFSRGELFEDEVLRAGDPLQIGPVELELLIDELMADEESGESEEPTEACKDPVDEYISRLERLEAQLVELQQASDVPETRRDTPNANHEFAATISELATQLSLLQSRSTFDRELWTGERAELEALLHSRLRDFALLQDEVQRLGDELTTVRSEYGDASANADVRDRLAEVSQELAERTKGFEEEQLTWDRDRGEFQRQLQDNMDRLDQFESQLAEQSELQAASDAARQDAEERADRLQESVDELSNRLAEQQEEYERVRAEWEADRESLETELADTKEQLAQSSATESIELELREAWDRERTALESRIADTNTRLAEALESLEVERLRVSEEQASEAETLLEDHSFDEISGARYNPMDRLLDATSVTDDQIGGVVEPAQGFTGPDAIFSNPAEPEYRADSYSDAVAPESAYASGAYSSAPYESSAYSGAEEDAQPYGDFQSDGNLCAATADEGEVENPLLAAMKANQYTDRRGAVQSADVEQEEENAVAFQPVASDTPVNTSDILAKFIQSGPESDEERGDDELGGSRLENTSNPLGDALAQFAETEASESHYEQPQYTPVNETPFSSSPVNVTTNSDGEEESIEDYMARLMKRVRATDDEDLPTLSAEPAAERSPVTEYTEVTPVAPPVEELEPDKMNSEEYKPRSQAPEMADRMTAMRSLANDTARSAIASHAKRNWSSVMKLKLIVSVFTFVAVLASLIFFRGNPLLMGLGSFVGLGVLGYWARTAITYRKLLLESLILEPNGGRHDDLDSSEDAA